MHNSAELWRLYHENTKVSPRTLAATGLSEREVAHWMLKGKKTYPIADKLPLYSTEKELDVSLESALVSRRSTRRFASTAIPFPHLSKLLSLSYGVSGRATLRLDGSEHRHELRTAPSAGALFSCELYVVAVNVEGVNKGVYHYSPEGAQLACLECDPDVGKRLDGCIADPEQFADVGAALVITGSFSGVVAKYGDRGYRYVLLDAGHIGQNIYLSATALGMGTVGVCGFYEDRINDLLALQGENESAIYVLLAGMLDDGPATGRAR